VTVDLQKPLDWEAASAATTLKQLQPNILKAHVRNHLAVLLLSFEDRAEGRRFLHEVAHDHMKSALQHLEEVKAHKRPPYPQGTTYVGVALSATGYATLGVPDDRVPADGSFRRGMKAAATRRELADPPVTTWELPYRESIHAIVLIGDAREAPVRSRRAAVLDLMPDSVTLLGEETGLYRLNAAGDGIEHFGYVDGRSQPLFLTQDIDEERDTKDGITVWDPAFPLEQVLVADSGVPRSRAAFGSYLVFRKLEQNVRGFKQEEERLADDLELEDEDRERAGALLVGRFEDGTPLTLQRDAGAHHPVMNDFTYGSDAGGMKCPQGAHIRKVNARDEATRARIMARRGQTYGERCDDLNDEDVPAAQRPAGGVGLLFMAFNANVGEQFEYTQARLANASGGGATDGVDPLIGQGQRPPVGSPTVWGGDPDAVRVTDPVAQAVTMKGGEYFFAPSLQFMRNL
jgi:Dyp-type peroxidase family